MKRLRAIVDSVPVGINWVALSIGLPAMMILVTVDAVGRYALNSPLKGAEEIVNFLLMFVVFSSFAYVWVRARDTYVHFDSLVVRLSPRWKAIADLLAAVTGAVFTGALTYTLILKAMDSRRLVAATDVLVIPLWPLQVYAAFGSLLFTLVILVSIVRSIRQVGGRSS